MPTTRFISAPPSGPDAAERSRAYVRRHWRTAPSNSDFPLRPTAGPDNLFERIRTHALCISGMAFQDVWNLDLERLQRCCIHVVSDDLHLVPFCAYYLTDSAGRRLKRLPAHASRPAAAEEPFVS